jgi:hypothetical protein
MEPPINKNVRGNCVSTTGFNLGQGISYWARPQFGRQRNRATLTFIVVPCNYNNVTETVINFFYLFVHLLFSR